MTDLPGLRLNSEQACAARFKASPGGPARWVVRLALGSFGTLGALGSFGIAGNAYAGSYNDLADAGVPIATATNSAAGAIEVQAPAVAPAAVGAPTSGRTNNQTGGQTNGQTGGQMSGPAHVTHLPMAPAAAMPGIGRMANATAPEAGSTAPPVPTRSTMPALGTISPGLSMGSVMPPGMRPAPRIGSATTTPVMTPVAAKPAAAVMAAAVTPAPVAAPSLASVAAPVAANPATAHNAVATAPDAVATAANVAAIAPIAAITPAPNAAPAPAVTIVTARDPIPGANPLGDAIKAAAEHFLMEQTVGLPGEITVSISPVSARNLSPCPALEAFLPPGASLWGHTTVGVRCVMEKPWTLYVQARISVRATYFLATRSIAPGETIQQADLVPQQGDLTFLPRAVITDASQAVGSVALARITPGLPLRRDMMRAALSVQQGQTVHLIASGPGFSITADGSAMQNAATGEQVKVKTGSGQIVIGIVRSADTVEIPL
jgi:flagella basal body P-ring formation protein FlgA